MVLQVTSGDSLVGSAVETKTSTPGRSNFPVGLAEPGRFFENFEVGFSGDWVKLQKLIDKP